MGTEKLKNIYIFACTQRRDMWYCVLGPVGRQLASLRLSICYRWGGTQWGFGSGACLVSVARVRVSVPRWNLNGCYSWALQIHIHCTQYDRWSTCTRHDGDQLRGIMNRNHRWTEQPRWTIVSTFITSYICCPALAPFTGSHFPPLYLPLQPDSLCGCVEEEEGKGGR